MNDLEQELKHALGRTAAPEGFADRVMIRVAQRDSRPRVRPWLAAAAALTIGVFGVGRYEYRRMEAEKAKAELIYALEIASGTLQETRAKLIKRHGR